MFLIPTSVILFVFFWYLSSKEKAKAKKENEKDRKRDYAKFKQEIDQDREERERIPIGFALTHALKYEKLSEEQITLLKKPSRQHTGTDDYEYSQFCRRYRNYNLPL